MWLEASYAVLALQMLPHAVGFSKEPPGTPGQIKISNKKTQNAFFI
jgi:hypothetical protein